VVGLGHGPGTDVVVVTIVGLGLGEDVMLGTATGLGLLLVTVGNGYGARISGRTGDEPGATPSSTSEEEMFSPHRRMASLNRGLRPFFLVSHGQRRG
jgi:hypothetical protein